jgi:hypothetical protein
MFVLFVSGTIEDIIVDTFESNDLAKQFAAVLRILFLVGTIVPVLKFFGFL